MAPLRSGTARPEAAMQAGRNILIGIVGAPQGIKGEVRVKSYTGDPRALGQYGPLQIEPQGRTLRIAGLRHLRDDMVVVRFEGIGDRNAAAALTGTRLYVDRARLPPPEAEEFYQADLIGLSASTPDGAALGQVVAVQDFGAGDILEIGPEGGDTVLVPFTKAFVPLVDFERGTIIVEPGALGTGAESEGEAPDHGGEASA